MSHFFRIQSFMSNVIIGTAKLKSGKKILSCRVNMDLPEDEAVFFISNGSEDCELLTGISKYKQYDEINLKLAVNEVKAGKMSSRTAQTIYSVPYRTISRHVKNLTEEKKELNKRGPPFVLTASEENDIANWLVECSKRGDPKSKDDLIYVAGDIRKLRDSSSSPNFTNYYPTPQFVKGFLERHPFLSFRTPEHVTQAAALVSEERISNFFTKLREFIDENSYGEILDRPEAWLNIDETSFSLGPKSDKVLAEKGSRTVYQVESGPSKSNITVTYCFNANGEALDTQVIFKNNFTKLHEAAYMAGKENANVVFSQTENGWQNMNSFEQYIKHLVEQLDHIKRPIIITFDNHPSHLNVALFKWCKARGVELVTFPPNTTHILQPADVGVFGPAKSGWKVAINKWKRENQGQSLNEVSFMKVLADMNKVVMKTDTIKNSFKATGLYPLNIENVHFERVLINSEVEVLATNATGNVVRPKYRIEENTVVIPTNRAVYFRPENATVTRNEQIPTSYVHHDSVNQLVSSNESEFQEMSNEESVENGDSQQNSSVTPGNFTLEEHEREFMIDKMNEYAELLHKHYTSTKDENFIINTVILKRHLEIFKPNVLKEQVRDSIGESGVKTGTIHDILVLPEPHVRKTKRTFKRPNCGLMTSDEIIKSFEDIEAEKEKVQTEKNERKRVREANKLSKNIKQEKLDDEPPRKRGRPKKVKLI